MRVVTENARARERKRSRLVRRLARVRLQACVGRLSWRLGLAQTTAIFMQTVLDRLEEETIARRLSRSWDPPTRFPAVVAGLISPGRIEPEDAAEAMRELAEIGEELAALDADEIVWRCYGHEVRARERRWKPAAGARNAAEAFQTPDGDRLVDVLRVALAHAQRRGRAMVVRTVPARRGTRIAKAISSEPSPRRER